ncbi:hypothetical protein QFZ48_000192 [Chitinophaga sp. W2I13]|uniref:RagB/SusD family nutrient uptake outer membrane protein n=1 Tax=Chitinophaga sp. W2I13 TaxID=3373923 RepID=UPI003D20DF36
MKIFISNCCKLSLHQLALIGLIILLPLSGCKKMLESDIYSQLAPENFFQTEGDANVALITLYNPFTSNWGNADPGAGSWYGALYNADIKSYFIRSLMTTDELQTDWDANLTNFTFGPSTWVDANDPTYPKIRYVAKATDVINNIEKSTLDAGIKRKYIAEAKVLRAWLMYVLYDFYGPVNAKTDPATLADNTITPRPDATTYSAQIEADLTAALPDLSDKYNSDATNWGRVSKGVARMLLLKLYMHNKEWNKAEATAKEIMTMNYSLEDNYADIFKKKAGKELIYAVPTNDASPNYWIQEVLPGDFKQAGSIQRAPGWGGYYMPWSFYNKYETNDTRKTTIIDHYTKSDGTEANKSNGLRGAIPLKYTSIQGDGPGYAIDVVVFRYAEVLLAIAEAINEQRGPGEAYQYVNQVRARAGVPNFTGLTQAGMRTALLDERGRELYGEGVRRQDLVRNGSLITNALARGKTNARPYQVLFPIPSAVIIEGKGIIKQNDGYPQ